MIIWAELIEELDQWTAQGDIATFWWRDDDADMPSAQLDVMLTVAGTHPLSLAVVPGQKDLKPLAARIASLPHVSVLLHGWKHASNMNSQRGEHTSSAAYAGTWQTPNATGIWSEYPDYRPFGEVSDEIKSGYTVLRDTFGNSALPVFVPPYHVFSDRFLPLLSQNGIAWICRLGPRQLWGLGLEILDINSHVDLMDWTVRGLGDPQRKIKVMRNHLRARRMGQININEPTGIYTHHLYQDEKSWEFIRQLLAITDAHKSTKWLHGREVFSFDNNLKLQTKINIRQLMAPVSWDQASDAVSNA